jgi:hypothetical protein
MYLYPFIDSDDIVVSMVLVTGVKGKVPGQPELVC